MTRIIMSGCNGAMGRTIANIVEEDAEAKIVAGVDVTDAGDRSFPVFKSIADCQVEESSSLIALSMARLM